MHPDANSLASLTRSGTTAPPDFITRAFAHEFWSEWEGRDLEGRDPSAFPDWQSATDAIRKALRDEDWSPGDAERAAVLAMADPLLLALYDADTGEYLREATEREAQASLDAARIDGGAGAISVDGRRCYCQ